MIELLVVLYVLYAIIKGKPIFAEGGVNEKQADEAYFRGRPDDGSNAYVYGGYQSVSERQPDGDR
jgi:hypothetical protein